MPILTTPILLYYIGENRDNTASDILKFFKDKKIDTPLGASSSGDGTGFSPSTKISIKNKLEQACKDGKITEDEYEKYTKKVSFTGKNAEIEVNNDIHSDKPTGFFDKLSSKISDGWNQFKENLGISNGHSSDGLSLDTHTSPKLSIQDIAEHPSLINSMSAEDIANIDVSMPSELLDIINMPDTDVPIGLMSDILADLPEGFCTDDNLLNLLKNIVSDATDMV